MPVIYYSYYTPYVDKISENTRKEHTLGRTLLLEGLKELFGVYTTLDELKTHLIFAKRGKPHLKDYPDIYFNISHTQGLVACAFYDQPVGVDVEMAGHFADVLIKRVLSDEEKMLLDEQGITPALRQEWFYRLWTLKEAFVKRNGVGVGLGTELKSISFTFDLNSIPFKIGCSDSGICCFQEILPGGYVLSLCFSKSDKKGDPHVRLIKK